MGKTKTHKAKFTHEAKMIVTNHNPEKVPDFKLSPGFKYVEVEITGRDGSKVKEVVALHAIQIEQHKK
jgi:hypothetical protein